MHLSTNVLRVRIPIGIIILSILICLLGIGNLLSAAQATRPNLYLVQTMWLTLGLILGFVLCLVRTETLKNLAYPIYFGVIALLLLVFVIGVKVKGSQRWIDLGFFNLQPSELAKIAIVFVTARYFSDFRVRGGITLSKLLRPFNITRPALFSIATIIFLSTDSEGYRAFYETVGSTWAIVLMIVSLVVALAWIMGAIMQISEEGLSFEQFVAPIDIVFAPFVLILIQPDLGTSGIVLAIAFSMILFCGIRRSSLIVAALSAVLIAIMGWTLVLQDYQKQRIETFLNPEADIHGHGYHAAQSIIAIGSGELAGKGFGEGTQTQLSFLPENHTDFVFSVLGEEWGFMGTVILLMLYLALIYQMLQVAHRANDRFASLLVVGGAMVIFWHVLINTGMVTGLLPVVGVTLPLMSYGGSSLLTQLMAIALAVNVSIWRRA